MKLDDGLSAGDIVVRTRRAFLVVLVTSQVVKLVGIVSPGTARHRAHVQPRYWCDLATSGLSQVDVVFACERIVSADRQDLHRIGRIAPGLLAKVIQAIRREHSARSIEDEPSVNSNLLAFTASTGRRVGVVRYA